MNPGLWVVWLAALALSMLACGVDLALCPRRVSGTFDTPETLYIGSQDPLRLHLAATERELRIEVLTDLDDLLVPQPMRSYVLAPGGDTLVEIPLVPLRRGMAYVEAAWLRWTGPLGLMRRQIRFPLAQEVPVVPDVRSVQQAALRFFTNREFLSGLKVERYLGDGTEFDSLREYVPGLDHRSMNWKASARHRKLYCTDYRAERNHQVVLALDTGHLMCEPIDGLTKLDRCINAALLLSYTCMRTGDRVGWFSFDQEVGTFSEPDSGARAYRRLQQLSADVTYSRAETNFTLGLSELSLRLKRRSLVVLLTDFVDTITAELMIENLSRLSRRHLVLFVTLRDPALARVVDGQPQVLDDVYRAVVAGDFVRERELVLRRLGRLGVRCIDTPPSQVTTGLLNQYLDAKRRELF